MSKKLELANEVVPFLGPIIFEVANVVTGEWINEKGKLSLSMGKWVTISIGILYIGVMAYLIYRNKKNKADTEVMQAKIENLSKENINLEKSNETVCTLMGYLREKISDQIEYFKEHRKMDVRDLNMNSASNHICKVIYQNIMESHGNGIKATVNMYMRTKENGAEYSIMVAHEGHISQPNVFGVRKLLNPKKKNSRYSEKILGGSNPDYRILLSKAEVAKAFQLSDTKCKYNQYLGIPIRKKGGNIIALIEIVLHENSTIWKDKDEANRFAAHYCEILKEYVLLMDKMYEQGVAIAQQIVEEMD